MAAEIFKFDPIWPELLLHFYCNLQRKNQELKMPSLSNLDDLYKKTISKLPKEERLLYCNQTLDKAQNILQKNLTILDNSQKEQLGQMIKAAQNEIRKTTEAAF